MLALDHNLVAVHLHIELFGTEAAGVDLVGQSASALVNLHLADVVAEL